MKPFAGNKGIPFYLFMFLFGVYFLSAAGNNINGTDQQLVRFEQTRSMVEERGMSIPDGMGVKGNFHKDYSWYGIGQPILAVPFYIIGKGIGGQQGAQVMVSLLNQVVVAASGVILFLFIMELGYAKKTALTITIFYALGTLAWPQSKHPFDHPVEMLFVLLAVFYAHQYGKDGRIRYLLFSSASLGFAFITRVPAALALLPILFLLSFRQSGDDVKAKGIFAFLKDCVIYSLILLPFVLVQLWYNYTRFGSIFETGITLMAHKAGIDFFAGTHLFTGLRGFLISPGKGFFYYSPITVLIFFSLKGFYKRQKGLTFCLLGIIFSYLVFLSRNIYWHGDWAWGPRYLLVITPLLMLPVADFIEKKAYSKKNTLRPVILGLFIISISVQLIGVSVDFNRYFISLQKEKGVAFTLVGGNDVPYTREPPPDTYFDWDKSPVVYQASFVWKNLKSLKAPLFMSEAIKEQNASGTLPNHAVFDFWWHYGVYSGLSPSAIVAMLSVLGCIITFSWFRVLKMVKE